MSYPQSKQKLYKNIYQQRRQNSIIYNNKIKQIKNIFQDPSQILQQYLSQTKVNTVKDRYSDYPAHQKSSFFIYLRNNVETISDIDATIPILSKLPQKKKKQIYKEIYKILKISNTQITLQDRWQFILKRYLCSFDSCQRIEIYNGMKRYGMKYLSRLYQENSIEVPFSLMIEYLQQSAIYLGQNNKTKDTINNFNTAISQQIIFCKQCNIYQCSRHITRLSNSEQSKAATLIRYINDESNIIRSFLQCLQYINKIEKGLIESFDVICDNGCFKSIRGPQLQHLKQEFLSFNYNFQFIEKAIKVVYFDPCKLSPILNISCKDIYVYILIQFSLDRLYGSLMLEQSTYLQLKPRNILDLNFNEVYEGCKCRKSKCKIDVCPCLQQDRLCKQIDCRYCNITHECSSTFKKNKIFIKALPMKKLGVFSSKKIIKNEPIICITGEQFQQNIQNIHDAMQKINKATLCDFFPKEINNFRMGNQFRFVRHVPLTESNSYIKTIKIINKQKSVIYLFSSKCIQEGQQITFGCNCQIKSGR